MSFSLVFPLQTAIREAFKRREAMATPWYARRVYGLNDHPWFEMASSFPENGDAVLQSIMVIHVYILGFVNYCYILYIIMCIYIYLCL